MAANRASVATAACVLAAVLAGASLSPAIARPLAVLNAHDLTLYQTAFDDAQRGDSAGADRAMAGVSDRCLVGKVRYLELTRAKARKASYDDLANWLKRFADMPGASEVYELALRRKPSEAAPPRPAATTTRVADGAVHLAPAPQSKAAREAYFSGDVAHALTLANASGDAWIAGLAAYRTGQFADAMVSFETLAANPAEDDATRAAGAYWAAKAAEAAGLPERATPLLKIAAAEPDTFYGMIAKRALELTDDPVGRLIEAADKGALTPGSNSQDAVERLIRTDPHARRAVALTQLGRTIDAGAELRTGFAQARDAADRAVWMGLIVALNPQSQGSAGASPVLGGAIQTGYTIYPTPTLRPTGGFTVDKALVYAVVWQESRFDKRAVSPVGAVGLMQLMPPSAANMAGDASLVSDPSSLFDAGKNLELGQAYLSWLEANAADYDILRTVAAYNGGPATLARTEALVGADADSLMVIESMPAAETRAYVKKVMAAYWSYRRQFGAPTRTLDAVASGMRRIDARLDSPAPGATLAENAQAAPDPASSAEAREALDILLRQSAKAAPSSPPSPGERSLSE